MNLRDMLKMDFGLELNIGGGFGQHRQDPIIVLDRNHVEASMTEMRVLKALGVGRGIHWRFLERNRVEMEHVSLEQIKIETKEFSVSETITTHSNYYFDVSRAMTERINLSSVIAFSDPVTHIQLPYELGWLHYDGLIDNEPQAAGLGKSIAYGAPGIKATVYLYDRRRTDIQINAGGSIVGDEFALAVSELMQVHPSARQVCDPSKSNILHFNIFDIGENISVLAVGVLRGKFIKLRITCTEHLLLHEILGQSIVAFQSTIAGNAQVEA